MTRAIQTIKWTWFALPVAALCAGILPGGTAQAAGECLSAPNGKAAAGSHWYYHLDHATGHKCWYQGPQGQSGHQGTAKQQAAARTRASTKADDDVDDRAATAAQAAPAVPETRAARATQTGGAGGQTATPADAPLTAQSAEGANQASATQAAPAAVQWPDPPAPATAAQAADAGNGDAATQDTASSDVTGSTAAQDAAPAAGPKAGAPEPAQVPQTSFLWMLLQVGGALLAAGAVFYVSFKIPAWQRRRAAFAQPEERQVRFGDDRRPSRFAPEGRSSFPLMPDEPAPARSDPDGGLRQVLRALDNASARNEHTQRALASMAHDVAAE